MKKQGPGFADFSPGQSPLSHEARVLDLVDLSSVLGCEQLQGSNRVSTVWLQDFQGHLLLGSYHAVPPFPRTSWQATLGPALSSLTHRSGPHGPPSGSLPGLRWEQ